MSLKINTPYATSLQRIHYLYIIYESKSLKMHRKSKYLGLLIGCFFFLTACEKDEPAILNEEELITTVTYTLTPVSGGQSVVLSFKDLDGDGGVAPIITGGNLSANETYSGSLDLLNEAESPVVSITEEIQEEDEDHQFFYVSNIAGLSISYDDEDSNGAPVGLMSLLATGNAGSGTLSIILRHEPDKNASGVSDGDLQNAGGETDIEISFPINVE